MALSETIVRKNTAANVLRWGTGASSIDPGRIPTQDRLGGGGEKAATSGNSNTGGIAPGWMIPDASEIFAAKVRDDVAHAEVLGRWPSTLIHDNSEEVLEMFAAFGKKNPACLRRKPGGIANAGESADGPWDCARCFQSYRETEEEAFQRFIYQAKASKRDRHGSRHPTVKPVKLVEILATLITPAGGTILDPFAGSGTTGKAALNRGFNVILIEQEPAYYDDCLRRLRDWQKRKPK